ncbi:UNC93-like protein [Portunus trituberculatus]|uniref:UNC93-like protein n=1 Tax=Portunus trituberculatus TaxID=210409 RepID=A0A5B7D8G6_PORTR|nr:UNC93-like protein [Portunus trituberculatus]
MADHDKKQGLHNPAFSNDDGKLEPCVLCGPRGLQAHGFESCPRSECRKSLPRVRKPNLHMDRGQDSNPCAWRPLGSQSTHDSTVPRRPKQKSIANGTVSLTIIYVALVVSCCFLPSLFIKFLKSKYTMALCMGAYSTYIAAQFYPTLSSLLPTGILLGIAAAPLWSAKCTYLTKVGNKYADLTGQNEEVIVTRYFGIFFLFFQSTQVWGNLISSTVLSSGGEELNKTEEELNQCGYNFCLTEETEKNSTGNGTDDIIPDWQRYTMASIYLVFALLSSVIIMLFVDPLSRFCGDIAETEEKSSIQLLIATFNHMRHPYQLLIIPLTIWSGSATSRFFLTLFRSPSASRYPFIEKVGIFIAASVLQSKCLELTFGTIRRESEPVPNTVYFDLIVFLSVKDPRVESAFLLPAIGHSSVSHPVGVNVLWPCWR